MQDFRGFKILSKSFAATADSPPALCLAAGNTKFEIKSSLSVTCPSMTVTTAPYSCARSILGKIMQIWGTSRFIYFFQTGARENTVLTYKLTHGSPVLNPK